MLFLCKMGAFFAKIVLLFFPLEGCFFFKCFFFLPKSTTIPVMALYKSLVVSFASDMKMLELPIFC